MPTPVVDAPAVTEKYSAPAALRPPYQGVLPILGSENASRADIAIGQSNGQ